MNHSNDEAGKHFRLPHIGQRIAKTTIAVFLCLLIYWLRGYHGQDMPTESAITAIICMQPYVRDSKEYALNRAAGTLIGAFFGLLLLFLLFAFPKLGSNLLILYALMAFGVLLSLYTAVVFRKPDASSLAAIVFLCIVIAFPDIENPLQQAGRRLLDVFIGTVVAITVNVFRLPRRKNRSLLFFVKIRDLVPDRFSHISPAALYKLNYLYDDGAKICLMSEHAPAFFALHMGGTHLNTPMIVMDGAAVYDVSRNQFLLIETIALRDSERIRVWLMKQGISCFIYTVHDNRTCIYHQGKILTEELTIYEIMRRSPYRIYLEGEDYNPEEIVYFKIIRTQEKVEEIRKQIMESVSLNGLRTAVHEQPSAPGIYALYIYSETASMELAQIRLLDMLRKQEPGLVPAPVSLKMPYQSERDAIHLLNQIEKKYEPLWIRKETHASE